MIERLTEATRRHHADADSDFDLLFADDTSAAHYRAFLSRAYAFEAPLEETLAITPNLDLVLELDERRKVRYLLHDLVALGMTRDQVDAIVPCAIPQFRGAAEALGWMYVVERTTLAHCVIRRHLLTRIPRGMSRASQYLQCYAGVVGRRWRELGTVLDDVARNPEVVDRIVAAAGEAFRTQQRLRTEQRAPASFRLRAV